MRRAAELASVVLIHALVIATAVGPVSLAWLEATGPEQANAEDYLLVRQGCRTGSQSASHVESQGSRSDEPSVSRQSQQEIWLRLEDAGAAAVAPRPPSFFAGTIKARHLVPAPAAHACSLQRLHVRLQI
jgi:hypothetical protein